MKNIKNKAWMPLLLATALLAACQDQPVSSGEGSSKASLTSSEPVVATSSSESSEPSTSSESSSESSSSSSSVEAAASKWSEVGGDAFKALTDFFQAYDSSATADDSLPFFQTGGKNVEWIVDSTTNPGRGQSVGLVAKTGDDATANKLLVGAYSSTLASSGFTKMSESDIDSNYSDNLYIYFGAKSSINAYKFANYDDTGMTIEVLPLSDIDVDNGYNDYGTYPQDADSNDIKSGGILIYIQGLGA